MSNPKVEETVVVDKAALVQILRAFVGEPYMLRELQATIHTPTLDDLPPNPVKILMDQVNAQHQGGEPPSSDFQSTALTPASIVEMDKFKTRVGIEFQDPKFDAGWRAAEQFHSEKV